MGEGLGGGRRFSLTAGTSAITLEGVNSSAEPTLSREAYLQRHLPFNLFAFLVDAGGYWLGMSLLSSQTILPFFVKELGGSDLLVGVIPSLTSLYLLPQLFAAQMTERRVIQSKTVLGIAFLERFYLGMLAVVAYFLAKPSPGLTIFCLFLLLGLNALTMGVNMPGYATMLTKTIPANKRGRLWGIAGGIGGIIALGGAKVSAWLLQTYGMPLGFTYCFLLGFVILMVTVVPLGFVREPEALHRPDPLPLKVFWSESWALLRKSRGFFRLIAAESLFSVPWIAPAFYTAYAKDHFHATYAALGQFTMMQIAASVVQA